MRAGYIITILGTAVATLVSAVVLPPNSPGADLVSRADPGAKYGCYCRQELAQTIIPLQNVTEACCPWRYTHEDGRLCAPMDLPNPVTWFLQCCVKVGGGHTFGGECETMEEIQAAHGNYPPKATETTHTSIRVTPNKPTASLITTTVTLPTTTQTATLALVGPRQNNDDEKHYCWCYPYNVDFTTECCTQAGGLFYHDKLCVVSPREKEWVFDSCCKDRGGQDTADYGACIDIDPEDQNRPPFTTRSTLVANREVVTTSPTHKSQTSHYYITHHPVTL
ncbi:hypothetical protein V8F33_006830 [Rhypophila sp. PSN 637]